MNCSDWLPTSLAKTFSSDVLCSTLEGCRTDCRTEVTGTGCRTEVAAAHLKKVQQKENTYVFVCISMLP